MISISTASHAGDSATPWLLADSHSSFFSHTRTPPVSFWRYFFQYVGETRYVDDPKNAPVMNWEPSSSNCSDLQDSFTWVTNRIPEGLAKFVARDVFVGRVLDGRTNAFTTCRKSAAYISLPLQLTNAISAYIYAFNLYAKALRDGVAVLQSTSLNDPCRLAKLSDLEKNLIVEIWREIQEARRGWKDLSQISSVPTSLMGEGDERKAIMEHVIDVERFVLAHEYAHAVLGHSTGAVLDDGLSGILEKIVISSGFELGKISDGGQRNELLADAFALLLCAGTFVDQVTFQSIYRASYAGMMALIAGADVGDNLARSSGQTATHPDLVERQVMLSRLVHKLSQDRPPEGNAHPVLFMGQLESFVTVALQVRAIQNWPQSPVVSLTYFIGQLHEAAVSFHRSYSQQDIFSSIRQAQATAHERSAFLAAFPDADIRQATPDHWAFQMMIPLWEQPKGYCHHLTSRPIQTQYVYAWEGYFRCEGCWGQHAAASKVRGDIRLDGISEIEDGVCDKCRNHVGDDFAVGWVRIGTWVLILGLCTSCQETFTSDSSPN